MAHFYQEIGKRIECLRKERGYGLEELEELVCMERGVLVAFEDGRIRMFVDQISKLAEVLGVTTDYLIYGSRRTNKFL